MALLDRVKLRTGSDLPDEELQAMIDGIAQEMDARFGPAGPITVEFGDLGDPCSRMLRTLRLSRPLDVAQPVEIEEAEPGDTGQAASITMLAAGDFHPGASPKPTGPARGGRSRSCTRWRK
jgi:hypothetical protein